MVGELALAVILLAGAGLLIRSFAALRATDPGFQPERVLSMSVRVPEAAYRDGSYVRAFYRDLLDRIRELPGVGSAAAGTAAPMSRDTDRIFTPEGSQGTASQQWPRTDTKWVTSEYFQTLGIPLLGGRAFNAGDSADSPWVVIVDKEIAERYWPGEDPVGKRVQWGQGGARPWLTVIGVAGNVKDAPFDQESLSATYVPFSQAEDSRIRRMQFVIRTAGDPTTIGTALRAAVRSLDRNIPVAELRTMFEVISGSMASRRFNMLLLSVFAGLALLLTMVGVYGVVAYSVAQRTHEIGVRMALGARRGDVLRKVLQQGFALIACGICVGLAGAALLTRLMSSLLFGVEPGDKLTFTLAALVLAIVASLASYIPALRATRILPVEALRHE